VAVRYQPVQAGSRVRLRLASDERLIKLVREGDASAFETLYDRHSSSLLSFCLYMLGSRHDAEDALQATFASAHRALTADERVINLRPWLFTIARNACLTILRQRRPWVELNGEPALNGDPWRALETREEVRQLMDSLLALPERQRATLVLSELHGLSQAEIASVLGVRPDQVKAYAFQARSNMISERAARETDCVDIREQLSRARGAALLKSRLRRHLRSCGGCREYADQLAWHRRQLGILLPVVPSLALKYRALEESLGASAVPATLAGDAAAGGTMAGAAVLAGGGIKALVAKVGTGVAVVGAGAGVGASMLGMPIIPESKTPTRSSVVRHAHLLSASAGGLGGRTGTTLQVDNGSAYTLPLLSSEAILSGEPSSGPAPAIGAPPSPSLEPTSAGDPAANAPVEAGAGEPPKAGEPKPGGEQPAGGATGGERPAGGEEHHQGKEPAAGSEEHHREPKERHPKGEKPGSGVEETEQEKREHELRHHKVPPEVRKAKQEQHKAERERHKAERERRKAEREREREEASPAP
jgi:RNA polymerase sigma factor (sigma-70 family)